MRVFLIILVAWFLPAAVGASAFAQGAPASAGAAAGKPAGQGPARPNPLEPTGYTYEPENRRDPFVSLVRRGTESEGTLTSGARPSGLPGMATSEVALSGTIRGASGAWIALLRGVDRRTYMGRPGDKLLDGTISTVTENSVVILQQVNDPLSLATQREVRKVLRQTEEAK